MLDDYDRQALERIKSKSRIDERTGCWEWEGYRDSDGYGQVKYQGASQSAISSPTPTRGERS
jgi:hypothetical protein